MPPPGEQDRALVLVRGHRRGRGELRAGLVGAAEPLEQVAADARQQVVVRERRSSPRSPSTSSSPASGPKAMPSATARLSSTTGDGATLRRARRRARRSAPSPCPPACAPARGRRRSPPGARRARARRRAPPPGRAPRSPRPISSRSQRARSWSTAAPARRRRRARARIRDAWSSISATSPWTSASPRHELGQHAAEPQRVLAQRGPHPVVARRRRVALVEDQVDRPRAPSASRASSSSPRGHLERHLRLGERPLRARRSAARRRARARGTPARSPPS